MAWTTPPTFVSGTVLTAANLNLLGADLNYLYAEPACFAYASANISITTSGTWQRLSFDTNAYDNASMHSTVTNTWKVILPDTAVYHITGTCAFAASNVGNLRAVDVELNNSTTTQGSGTVLGLFREAPLVGSTITNVQVSFDYKATAGDFLSMFVQQDSGGALNANGGLNTTSLSAVRVSSG